MSKYKTHRCDEIRLSDVDKKVVISGFVETIRDLGGVVFLDIRDMYRNYTSSYIWKNRGCRICFTYSNRINCKS